MITGYVLNLNTRQDRWDEIVERFKDITSITLERVVRTRHLTNTTIGCKESHIHVIRMAKEKNLPFVLVLEDDCLITNPSKFDDQFTALLTWLTDHPNDWNIVNGGPTYVNGHNMIRLVDMKIPIVEVNIGFCTHFIIYNHTMYDKMLNCLSRINAPIDVCISESTKQLVTYPYLATQAPSHSDIQGRFTDYDCLFREAETHVGTYINMYKRITKQ